MSPNWHLSPLLNGPYGQEITFAVIVNFSEAPLPDMNGVTKKLSDALSTRSKIRLSFEGELETHR